MLKRSPAYGQFKKYIEDLIRPIYSKVGFEEKPDDEHLDVMTRSLVVSWACNVVGMKECTDQAVGQWKGWMEKDDPDAEGQNPVNVNMKGTVVSRWPPPSWATPPLSRTSSRGSQNSSLPCSGGRPSSTGTLARVWTRWSSPKLSPT